MHPVPRTLLTGSISSISTVNYCANVLLAPLSRFDFVYVWIVSNPLFVLSVPSLPLIL